MIQFAIRHPSVRDPWNKLNQGVNSVFVWGDQNLLGGIAVFWGVF